jgi:hypothetical protein
MYAYILGRFGGMIKRRKKNFLFIFVDRRKKLAREAYGLARRVKPIRYRYLIILFRMSHIV